MYSVLFGLISVICSNSTLTLYVKVQKDQIDYLLDVTSYIRENIPTKQLLKCSTSDKHRIAGSNIRLLFEIMIQDPKSMKKMKVDESAFGWFVVDVRQT